MNPFTVSKTYETWDEDALEAGETNDRGYEYEDENMSLRDVVREIENGRWEHDCMPFELPRGATLLRLYSADSDVDYRSGESTSTALHIRGSARAIRRLAEYLGYRVER